jgi:hypothetical protein
MSRAKITRRDVSIDRVFPSGDWRVSALVDGHLVQKRYSGYRWREAIKMFLSEVNDQQNPGGMSTLTPEKFRAQQEAHDWPRGMKYAEAKRIHSRAWSKGPLAETEPLGSEPAYLAEARRSLPRRESWKAEYRRAIAAPPRESKGLAEYYRELEQWVQEHPVEMWTKRAPTVRGYASGKGFVEPGENPPLREWAKRIYDRLRREGYGAQSAFWIAKMHDQADEKGILVEWIEDEESSQEERKPMFIVRARLDPEEWVDDEGTEDNLGGIDLGDHEPDAHHSSAYQYDAEAQVIAGVLGQLDA